MRRDYKTGPVDEDGCSVVELVWLSNSILKEPVTIHSACHLPIELEIRGNRVALSNRPMGQTSGGLHIFLANNTDTHGEICNHALVRLTENKEKLPKHHFVIQDFPN